MASHYIRSDLIWPLFSSSSSSSPSVSEPEAPYGSRSECGLDLGFDPVARAIRGTHRTDGQEDRYFTLHPTIATDTLRMPGCLS